MRTILRSTIAFAVVSIITATAPRLGAQPLDCRVLSGRVTDAAGSVLAGAHIDITDHETGNTVATLTGEDGRYVLPGLSDSHHYTVLVRRIGFVPHTEDDVQVITPLRSSLDVALAPITTPVVA
jgi:hypothetical protein